MAEPFNRDVWTSETRIYDEDHPRLQMIDDLLPQLERWLSRGEVEALLGPASDTPYFVDQDLVYWLGPDRNRVSVDSSWLVVDFDEAGLKTARVVSD